MEKIFFEKESSLNKQGLFETVPANQGIFYMPIFVMELNGLFRKTPGKSGQRHKT